MKKLLSAVVLVIVLLLFTYPIGVVIGLVLLYSRWRGYVRIVHPERLPLWQRSVILVVNHPSMLEPILLPGLFLRQFILHPFLFSPWSAPDADNFGKWYWFWTWPRAVFIPRRDPAAAWKALRRLLLILKGGGTIILHPEGGRTSSAGNGVLISPKGKRLRPFQPGFSFLAVPTGALVVPVWIEGTDKVLPNSPDRKIMYHCFPRFRGNQIVIRFGRHLRFQRNQNRGEINRIVQDALLALADEQDGS